jgi:integrase
MRILSKHNAGDYRLMILVAGLLGIRWADLVAITPEDFDFKKKTINVSKSLPEMSCVDLERLQRDFVGCKVH